MGPTKRTLTQKLGLLGVVSFLSYTAAVVFAPLAYPGYNWMAQAVSDLSAANAPSLALWNQLSAFYNVCEVVCATVVCIGIQGQKTRLLRSGIYLFAVMEWISAVGYRMFPLSDSGYAGAFQDVMHMAVTTLPKLSHAVQRIDRISCKSGNGLCNDVIDLPVQRILHHLIKLGAVVTVGAGDCFICIHSGKSPAFFFIDQLRVIAFLPLIRSLLGKLIG